MPKLGTATFETSVSGYALVQVDEGRLYYGVYDTYWMEWDWRLSPKDANIYSDRASAEEAAEGTSGPTQLVSIKREVTVLVWDD